MFLMEGDRFDKVPEELNGIVAAMWECKNPHPEEGCDHSFTVDMDGPYPRIEDGELKVGPDIPLKCPECGSAHFAVNGVEMVHPSP